MPRVPVAENTVGLAEPTRERFQAVDNGGGAFGAVGAGLQRAAQGVTDLAQQEAVNQRIYNEAAAKSAYNTADTQVRDLLYTGKDAFFEKQGFDAVGAKQPTMDALAKVRSTAYASLKNPQQQRMFADAFDARIGAEQAKVAGHANQNLIVESNRQSESRQVNAQNNALDNADTPELYDRFVATGENEIREQGTLNGWGADVVSEKVAEYKSGTIARVADAKMTADPVGAAAWAGRHDADLLPADRAKLQAALYQPLAERRAEADVDGLMHTSTGALSPVTPVPTGGGSVAARMVAITAFSESRNRDRDAKGNIVTSSAGAQG